MYGGSLMCSSGLRFLSALGTEDRTSMGRLRIFADV